MTSAIQGVYAAAVTPRRLGSQDINLGVMWELVDFLVGHGAQGIVLMGCTGEFVHFCNAERMRLMGVAAKRSRVPVVFNCSHSTVDGVVELAQAADASGAVAILVMPPYFFRYTQSQICSFYREVVTEAEVETPIMLYNIPQFTTGIAIETASELLRQGIVQGIKDSSGDPQYLEQLQTLRQEISFSLMVGNDALVVPARSRSYDGVISGVACALPEILVALDRAMTAGMPEVVTRLEARLRQFIEQSDKLPTPIGIKEAAILRGIKAGPHALACAGSLEGEIAAFREWFRGWLPTVLSECKHV